jgi:two-component system, chemotaxis family, response regulator Rcp1
MPQLILLVEDNPGDARLIEEAFRMLGGTTRLHVVTDGAEAMAFLRQEGEHVDARRPDLILLDINLPKLNGLEVLAQVKEDERLRTIPTLIVATSQIESDINESYRLQANSYLPKPVDMGGFAGLAKSIHEFWITRARLPTLPGNQPSPH